MLSVQSDSDVHRTQRCTGTDKGLVMVWRGECGNKPLWDKPITFCEKKRNKYSITIKSDHCLYNLICCNGYA